MFRSFNKGNQITHQTPHDKLTLSRDLESQIITLSYEVYSDKEEKLVPVPISTEYFHISYSSLAFEALELRSNVGPRHEKTDLGQDIKEIEVYKKLQKASVADEVFNPLESEDINIFTMNTIKAFPKNPDSLRLIIFTKDQEFPFKEQCHVRSFNTRTFHPEYDDNITPTDVYLKENEKQNTHVVCHPYELAIYLLDPEEHKRLYYS